MKGRCEGRAVRLQVILRVPVGVEEDASVRRGEVDPDAARATRLAAFHDWADGDTLVIGTHFGTPTAGILVRDGAGYKLEFDAD